MRSTKSVREESKTGSKFQSRKKESWRRQERLFPRKMITPFMTLVISRPRHLNILCPEQFPWCCGSSALDNKDTWDFFSDHFSSRVMYTISYFPVLWHSGTYRVYFVASSLGCVPTTVVVALLFERRGKRSSSHSFVKFTVIVIFIKRSCTELRECYNNMDVCWNAGTNVYITGRLDEANSVEAATGIQASMNRIALGLPLSREQKGVSR